MVHKLFLNKEKYFINWINLLVFLLILIEQFNPLLTTTIRAPLIGFLASLLLILCLRRNNYKIINTIFLLWWYGFLFIGVFSILLTVSVSESLSRLYSLILSMLYLGAISQYVRNKLDIMRVINYFIGGGLLFVLTMFFINYKDILEWNIAFLSFGMSFTYISLQTLFLLIWKFIYINRNRFFNGVFILFLTFMNAITGSKKALFFPFIFLAIIMILKNRKGFLKRTFSIILVLSIFGTFYHFIMTNDFLYNIVGMRVEGFLNYFTGGGRVDGSTRVRMGLMAEAWAVFLNNPFFGVGLGTFRDITTFGTYAHNNFLELLACLGILGFGAFYWIYFFLLVKLKRLLNGKNEAIAVLFFALLVTLLIHDLGTISYYRISLTFLICLAICFVNIDTKGPLCEYKKLEKEEISV